MEHLRQNVSSDLENEQDLHTEEHQNSRHDNPERVQQMFIKVSWENFQLKTKLAKEKKEKEKIEKEMEKIEKKYQKFLSIFEIFFNMIEHFREHFDEYFSNPHKSTANKQDQIYGIAEYLEIIKRQFEHHLEGRTSEQVILHVQLNEMKSQVSAIKDCQNNLLAQIGQPNLPETNSGIVPVSSVCPVPPANFENPAPAISNLVEVKTEPGYLCYKCGNYLLDKQSLVRHLESIHKTLPIEVDIGKIEDLDLPLSPSPPATDAETDSVGPLLMPVTNIVSSFTDALPCQDPSNIPTTTVPEDTPVVPIQVVKKARKIHSTAKSHCRDVTKRQEGYYCTCDVKFNSRKKLDAHLKLHNFAKKWKPSQTGKQADLATKSQILEDEHRRVVQIKTARRRTMSRTCEICDRTVKNFYLLYKHQVSVHGMTLDKKTFYDRNRANKSSAKKANKYMIKEKPKNGEGGCTASTGSTSTGTRPEGVTENLPAASDHWVDKQKVPNGIFCVCGLKFTSSGELRGHLIQKGREKKAKAADEVKCTKNSAMEITCKTCKLTFTTNRKLNKHLVRNHVRDIVINLKDCKA